jgi:hypothetical protein
MLRVLLSVERSTCFAAAGSEMTKKLLTGPVGSRYTGPDSVNHLNRALNRAPALRSGTVAAVQCELLHVEKPRDHRVDISVQQYSEPRRQRLEQGTWAGKAAVHYSTNYN